MKTIEERVYAIVDNVMKYECAPTATLEELGADSLDTLEMEWDLEKEFGIDDTPATSMEGRIQPRMTPRDIVLMIEYDYLNVKPEKGSNQ